MTPLSPSNSTNPAPAVSASDSTSEAAPPLSPYQRVVSNDIDVLHDTVEPFAVGHDLHALEPGVPLDGQVNALRIGAVNLVWVRYGGGGVIVDTPPTEGAFAMCAPIAPMGVEYRATNKRDTAEGSLVLSHDEPMRMRPHPQRGCLVIATSTGRLADHLADYLGQDHTPPLRFHTDDRPAIAAPSIVERTWRHVCGILDNATIGGLHPLAARSLEESLLTAILLGLPHTATPTLADIPRVSPHHLADFIREWLQAHHHRPIGVTDIAQAAGIGVRQLQAVCQKTWGITPTQLLRATRLDHARAKLLKAEPTSGTITEIAHAAGYHHMSRFAAHYRQRFGETPTQTLTRVRSINQRHDLVQAKEGEAHGGAAAESPA